MKKFVVWVFLISVFFWFRGLLPAFAGVGVGVGLGSINVSQPLSPGGIYHFPSLPVINTGSVAGTYQVRADLVNPKGLNSEPLGLDSGAFSFRPQTFPLSPDQSQLVKVSLTLPLTVPDGDYLAYLEASPIPNPGKGVAIGPAAATKVYFSVQYGTVLGAIRNRIITFILTRPEIYLLLAALLLLNAVLLLCRYYRIKVEVRSRHS